MFLPAVVLFVSSFQSSGILIGYKTRLMCPQHLEHKGHTVTGDSKGKLLIPQLCPQPQPPNCSYSLKSGKKKT